MAKKHYTFLIITNKKDAIKKVCASSKFLKYVGVFATVLMISMAYVLFDYVKTKRQGAEFDNVKKLAEIQRDQINSLAGKVMDFEKKMEYFRLVDEKIRAAGNIGRKSKSKGQLLGVGGFQHEQAAEGTTIDQLNKNIDRLLQDAETQEKSFQEVLSFLKKRESILASLPSLWPVKGWVTSNFGYRQSPYGKSSEFHKGIDIATQAGKPIMAPADGIVAESVNRPDMGNYVVLNHKNGVTTSYAHMLRRAVHPGKNVKKGEVIGYVGNSGRSTGSHLHYCVSLNGVPVNPRKYLP